MADKITKLSQAIRYGSTFLGESRYWMARQGTSDAWVCGCALGTAYLALNGTDGPYTEAIYIMEPLSKRFGVPVEVMLRVSDDHYSGRKTRAQCADWLESLGY